MQYFYTTIGGNGKCTRLKKPQKKFFKHASNTPENSVPDSVALYTNAGMNIFLTDKLQQHKMEIEAFDTSKAVYKNCANNLMTFSKSGNFKNNADYDNIVLEEMNQTALRIEKLQSLLFFQL